MDKREKDKREQQESQEFAAAFDEGEPAASTRTEEMDGMDGMHGEMAAEAAPKAEGEPAAVVVVAEASSDAPAGADTGSEAAANEAAAREAQQVNDAHNERASAEAGGESTATKEANGGGEAGAQPAAESSETPEASAETAAAQESGDAAAPAATVNAGDSGEMESIDDVMRDVPPEDMQKAKSWVGRLRKIEEQLKAKAANGGAPIGDASPEEAADATAAAAIAQAGEQAEEAGVDGAEAAAQQAAAAVASGDQSFEEAVAALREDFGDQFITWVEAIAKKAAGSAADEKVGALGKRLDDLEGNLGNEMERNHYEMIADVHPDFVDVSNEPAFQEYVAANGKQAIVDKGSARQINKLLSDYKASKPAAEAAPEAAAAAPASDATPAQDAVAAAANSNPPQLEEPDPAMDAAEGVRSGGLRLPTRPRQSSEDDYAAAWDEFS